MDLKGKVAVVTGSTSGIGLGIAEALASAGCNIMLNGFGDPAEIEALRAGLERSHGVTVSYDGADLMKTGGGGELIQAATAQLDTVDILVNNAGIQHVAPVQDFPEERWDAVVNLNLSAVFRCTKAALPQMLERNWGRVVNIASAHGLVASVNKAAYVAAKHGVVGLTKVTALETAETGVTCNAICPGWVLTPLVAKQIEARAEKEGKSFDEAKLDLVAEKQPSKEFVTPEQLGALAVFLCSEAAREIRGQAIPMDGGWTAQ